MELELKATGLLGRSGEVRVDGRQAGSWQGRGRSSRVELDGGSYEVRRHGGSRITLTGGDIELVAEGHRNRWSFSHGGARYEVRRRAWRGGMELRREDTPVGEIHQSSWRNNITVDGVDELSLPAQLFVAVLARALRQQAAIMAGAAGAGGAAGG